jgi:ParB family chromosome partitioning protein
MVYTRQLPLPLKERMPNQIASAFSTDLRPTPSARLKAPATPQSITTYAPISSVWEGSDGDLLEAMFKFYATIPPEPILDATYNAGRFWKGSARHVVSMDIDPQYKTDIVADNRKMTGVPSAKFGVVVYDPPHVGPQGRDKSKKRFDVDFGATVKCGKEHDWNLSYLYPPFLNQAKRVLKPDGLLLAKITDMVNNHKSKWPHCDFMQMAKQAGFTVCDLIIKIRNGPMVSTKWKEAHHARKRHCFWIVCRNSDDCERRSPLRK